MRKTLSYIFICMALLCPGMSIHAAAAEPLVYTGAEEFVMPGAVTSSDQIGRITAPSVFENDYTAFGLNIPEGCTVETFEDKLYDVDQSLKLYGYVPDLLLSTYAATVDKPDPELEDEDTMVLFSFFVGKTHADGTQRDITAYMQQVIMNLCQNDKLGSYIDIGERRLGRNSYLCYSLDYTKAIQAYYHTVYAGRSEHPAFDERFSYRCELFGRDLGDKYYMVMFVKSGEQFESAADLTSYIY